MTVEPLDELVEKLSAGDLAAAEQVYQACEPYLRFVIRKQLPHRLRSKFDSADVVQSIWADLLSGFQVAEWRFANAAQLRAFLLKATRNRLVDRIRRHQTEVDSERPMTEPQPDGFPPSRFPRPSEIVQAEDVWRRLLELCPPEHHNLLRLKRQGLSLAEISARTGLHADSIRRIVRQLARKFIVSGAGSPPRSFAGLLDADS